MCRISPGYGQHLHKKHIRPYLNNMLFSSPSGQGRKRNHNIFACRFRIYFINMLVTFFCNQILDLSEICQMFILEKIWTIYSRIWTSSAVGAFSSVSQVFVHILTKVLIRSGSVLQLILSSLQVQCLQSISYKLAQGYLNLNKQ